MPDLRIPADDFQIGDLVHTHDGDTIEVRDIERGDKGLLIVNPGKSDQLEGHVWEQATVTRGAPAPAQIEQALHLVASKHLAATTALQRWMRISFRQAKELLDALEQRGHVGPADGSKSRDVYVRYCEQCGRIGKRGYRTLASDEHNIQITECSNRAACRKRWPTQPRDDD